MAAVNKVILVGHLGRDPEVRYTPDGRAICNFTMATTDTWKDKNSGEKRERTEWHRVVVFGRLAEICGEYLAKGRQVYVEGKLQTRSWEKDGQTHYMTEIVASDVQFLGGRDDNTGGGRASRDNGRDMGYPEPPMANTQDDDIPF